jgi:putative oxidoreductase
VVAVLSLPDMPEAAFNLHLYWGSLLLGLLLWGPGRWSVDALVKSWVDKRSARQA